MVYQNFEWRDGRKFPVSEKEEGFMKERHNLKYIVIAALPQKEIKKLKENLINNTELELIARKDTNDLWKTFHERELAVEECLLVSGTEEVLAWGRVEGMPTIGYQPAETAENIEAMEEQQKSVSEVLPAQSSSFLQADIVVEGFEEVDDIFLLRIWQRYHGIPWTILETKRCLVREFEMKDLDDLFELYEHPKMTEYMEGLYPYEEEKEYQRTYIEYMYRFFGYGMWLVFEKTTGKLIGRAGIEHREELDGELELGYAIHPNYQRRGYATEVCNAIIDYAFTELEFEEICCLIEKENAASICFAKGLGFLLQQEIILNGKMMLKYFRKR